ncbi:glutamate receptor ionotropic, delta-1 isoform X2 [Trichoplusia ni]|uniref:Glutamate receptor ionotropic, delta-1 isoform X2 n=1 Tax=Trichoplusia ni TaxID=7111 RepID=A0A7E5X2H1_TRINI|nr:glutamate receptor ionotropic, delta-1 isoform X2 [Trichoplusia ni]
MAGIELIISSICNATYCEVPYNDNFTGAETVSVKEVNYQALAKEINGKNIKVTTYNNTPLSWIENHNGTLVGKGVAFIVMEILRKRFNFTYDVVEPRKNFELGGRVPDDSVIGLVNSTKVDMAAAFLPTLRPYQEQVSFSIILDEGTWVMMLKRPKESAAGSGLLAPFNELVWYLVLAAVVTFGPCITFFTRVRTKLIEDNEGVLPLNPSFWFVYSAFLKQGTNLSPEANTTRVLFVTWWLFMILLSAFYTANLTAFLTLSKFTLAIEDPKDLYDKNYRWVTSAGSSVEHVVKNEGDELYYLNSMISNNHARFLSVRNDKDFLDYVKKGAVLVKEQTVVDHLMFFDYNSKKDVEESDKCTYVLAPKAFMKKQRAFAFPIGSNLKNLFDPVLTKIFQAGILEYLKRSDLPSTKICPLDLRSKDRKLRNSDLIMTYVVMAAGSGIAMAVFAGEVFLKRYVKIKMNKGGKTKKKKVKLSNKKSRIYDDSRPPPYDSLFSRNPKFNVENTRTKMINGREYYIFETGNGDKKLIPVRAPSSFLYRSDK